MRSHGILLVKIFMSLDKYFDERLHENIHFILDKKGGWYRIRGLMKKSHFIAFSFLIFLFSPSFPQNTEPIAETLITSATPLVREASAAETPIIAETSTSDKFIFALGVPQAHLLPYAPMQPMAPALKPIVHPKQLAPRLIIPSIGLNSTIIEVGINEKGEMDVPSGEGNDVGWYKFGTVLGEMGSAVVDAHVFAAFRKLGEVRAGDDIYVFDNGKTLHFKVEMRVIYPLPDVPRNMLFERNDAKRLNLITCAGELTKDRSTYDRRLIVYAVLVESPEI